VRASVERRRMQAEFIARGLRSRDEAQRTGDYVDADTVLDKLQRKLDAAHALGEAGQVTFKVRLTRGAEADLGRLFDFLLERELSRDGGDLSLPAQAIAASRSGIATLRTSPFTCRKAGQSPFLRELIVSFGRSGYVALFEIEDEANVMILAVRHQLEDDCH
jgi:plasmid stabilization system protein ParE